MKIAKKLISFLLICSLVLNLNICFDSNIQTYAMTSSEFNSKLSSLRLQYPDYSVWNGTFDGGTQCYGFARLIAYNVFGTHVNSWELSYSLDGVKAGDVLQYGNTSGSGHTIFVTGVSGNTITYVDCNGNGNYSGGTKVRSCGIKWDNSINKGSLMFNKYSFAYRYVSPGSSASESCSCSTSYAGNYTVTANGGLNIRSGHDTSYTSLGTIPKGATVYVSKANAAAGTVGGWAHVSYNGINGYCNTQYLAVAAHNPEGCIDAIEGGDGTIYIRGWAFDRDDLNSSVELHVYIGGPAGSGNAECHSGIMANKCRTDLNAVYGVGDYHGFETTIKTDKTGNQPVYIYLCHVGPGTTIDPPELGHQTVTITKTYAPQGCVDYVNSEPGQINIKGWAFDKDAIDKAVEIQVYIGGPAGSSDAEGHTIKADAERLDVGEIYKVGNNHGFKSSIKTSKTGMQKIYVYAVDLNSNKGNVSFGTFECNIEPYYPLSNISVVSNKVIPVNGKYNINVTYIPSNATNKKLTYTSSNPEIASVDENGIVTGHKEGSAYITVTSEEGGYSGKCLVKVSESGVVYGDIDFNGKITISDVVSLNDMIKGNIELTDAYKVICDLNGDGKVNSADLELLSDYLSGVITYFPVEKLLDKIEISSLPSKTKYYVGDTLSTEGIVIKSYYRDGTSKEITNYAVNGTTSEAGEQNVVISYTEDGITRSTSYKINVEEVELRNLLIENPPVKTTYVEGESFDDKGMQIKAVYSNGTTKSVSGYKVKKQSPLNVSDKSVEIVYNEGNITLSVYQSITVISSCEVYGHTWGNYKNSGDKIHTKTCMVCGKTEQEACVEASKVIAATCVKKGYTRYTCILCGTSHDEKFTDLAEHAYDAGVEKNGVITYTCMVCGKTFREEINVLPTIEPTSVPTEKPTSAPSDEPTQTPTPESTIEPTQTPIIEPTVKPTTIPADDSGKIIVSKVNGKPGSTVWVDIIMDYNPGITSMTLDVEYDTDAMSLNSIKNGNVLEGATLITSGNFSVMPYRLIWNNGISNITATGTIVSLAFTINKEAIIGEYPIKVSYKEEDIYNTALENVYFDIDEASIVVKKDTPEVLSGDANNDGKVDLADAMIGLKAALGIINISSDDSVFLNIDVDNDGQITLNDCMKILRLALGIID